MTDGSDAPIEISSIKGSVISEDGRLVLLNCQAHDGSEKQIIIPTQALANLTANLQILTTSAEVVMMTSDPIEVPTVRFIEPEPVFFVKAMGGTVRPETGMIQLRIAEMHGNVFQISMLKDQSRVLYDLLLNVWLPDTDKPN